MAAPFFDPKIGEDLKKKMSSLQHEWYFGSKVCEDQKKSSLLQNQWVFVPNTEELWFHIIIWWHPKWWHPKMVTPGAGRPPASPSDATENNIEQKSFHCQ